jgi:hypothetical protein
MYFMKNKLKIYTMQLDYNTMQCIIPNPGWGGGWWGGEGVLGRAVPEPRRKITYARSARFLSNKLEILVEKLLKSYFPLGLFKFINNI